MAANDNKRYFWLKLDKDFFTRADIRVIEGMPNGKEYVYFYIKLLCESTSHGGNLRFSEEVAYTEDMLASVTNTNIDIVRSALKVLQSLKLVIIGDDLTIHMTEVPKMIDSATGGALRKRESRERHEQLNLLEDKSGTSEGQSGDKCP